MKAVTNLKCFALAFLTGVIAVPTCADEAATVTSADVAMSPRDSQSDAVGGHFGIGLLLGEPTGISAKYFFSDTLAVDGAVGWSFDDETDLDLHGDVLWHKFDLFSVPKGRLPLYVGVGVRVSFRDHADDRVGVRVPVGVSYLFDELPLDVFVEVAPVLDFSPSTRGSVNAGIGARWWF